MKLLPQQPPGHTLSYHVGPRTCFRPTGREPLACYLKLVSKTHRTDPIRQWMDSGTCRSSLGDYRSEDWTWRSGIGSCKLEKETGSR